MIRIRKRNSLAIEWCLSCHDSVNIYGDIGNQMNSVKLSQKHANAKELKGPERSPEWGPEGGSTFCQLH